MLPLVHSLFQSTDSCCFAFLISQKLSYLVYLVTYFILERSAVSFAPLPGGCSFSLPGSPLPFLMWFYYLKMQFGSMIHSMCKTLGSSHSTKEKQFICFVLPIQHFDQCNFTYWKIFESCLSFTWLIFSGEYSSFCYSLHCFSAAWYTICVIKGGWIRGKWIHILHKECIHILHKECKWQQFCYICL